MRTSILLAMFMIYEWREVSEFCFEATFVDGEDITGECGADWSLIMTTLQRSSTSFRRQGSSGRIWNDLQFPERKSGTLCTDRSTGLEPMVLNDRRKDPKDDDLRAAHSLPPEPGDRALKCSLSAIFGRCGGSSTSRTWFKWLWLALSSSRSFLFSPLWFWALNFSTVMAICIVHITWSGKMAICIDLRDVGSALYFLTKFKFSFPFQLLLKFVDPIPLERA